MKRVLSPALPKPGKSVELGKSEALHLTRVLRLRNGDLVEAIDGHGQAVEAILRVRGEHVALIAKSDGTENRRQTAHGEVIPAILEISILKGEAMEWVIEKAVELGALKVVPVITAHTVVKAGRKSPEDFRERWQRIADQALKQCGRLERLTVEAPTALESLMAQAPASQESPRAWCDEKSASEAPSLLDWLEEVSQGREKRPDSIRLLIGPEGGWSQAERELLLRSDLEPVSLGPLVLRAETAAIFGASLLASYFRS